MVDVDVDGGAVDVVTGAAVVVVVAIGTSDVDVGWAVSFVEVQPDTTSTKDAATSEAERTRTVIDVVTWRGSNQWIQIRGGESARRKSPTKLSRTIPLPAH